MDENKFADEDYIKALEGLSHRDYKALYEGVWIPPVCEICGAEKVHYRRAGYRCPHLEHHEMEQERQIKALRRRFRNKGLRY